MKNSIPAFLMMLGACLSTAARAEDWTVYQDEQHGCRLEYASRVFTQGPVDPDKFLRFTGPNKDIYFRVRGLSNEKNWTPERIRAEYIKSRGAAGVSYERTKEGFLVLSGIRGGNIFYTKVALSSDNRTICVLYISYPRKEKRAFDAIVTHMSHSFGPAS
jgi:hypothetical protein